MREIPIDDLVCPVCRHALQWHSQMTALKCLECSRVYPVREGIPVLLADQAVVETQS